MGSAHNEADRALLPPLTLPPSQETTPSPANEQLGEVRCCHVTPPSVVLFIVVLLTLLPPLRARFGLVGCMAASGSLLPPTEPDIFIGGPQFIVGGEGFW